MNLGVGEMGFMFFLFICSSKITFAGDINPTNLLCLTSVLPGDTSDSRNFHL